MNLYPINKAQQYLSRKFSITDPKLLYKNLLNSTYLFQNQELYHAITYLSIHQQRRLHGDQAKFKVASLLKQYEFKQQSYIESGSFLIGLSNLYLYDENLIKCITSNIFTQFSSFELRPIIKIYLSLYKLNLLNEPLYSHCENYLFNNFDKLEINDMVNFALLQTNLYCQGSVKIERIKHLLQKIINYTNNDQINNFLSPFNYHFVQMMFNLYPEILKQDIYNCNCQDDNAFSQYFNEFKKIYIIARLVIDRRKGFQSVDYFQYPYGGFLNIHKSVNKKQTTFEEIIEDTLEKLEIPYQKNKRYLIYDIDFLVKDQVILNCDGALHYITNLNNEIIAVHPNHLQVQRNLAQGKYRLVNVNYKEWQNIQFQEREFVLQKILQLI